jgi:hypothetical protein
MTVTPEPEARRGVVLVTTDASAAAFFDELIEDHAPAEGRAMRLRPGLVCIAAVGGSHRRRLVVIDGEPADIRASALIEAIRVVDGSVPIVLVRYDAASGDEHSLRDGVLVVGGPFVSPTLERVVSRLLADTDGT